MREWENGGRLEKIGEEESAVKVRWKVNRMKGISAVKYEEKEPLYDNILWIAPDWSLLVGTL